MYAFLIIASVIALALFAGGIVVGMVYERALFRPALNEAYRQGRITAERDAEASERPVPPASGVVLRGVSAEEGTC